MRRLYTLLRNNAYKHVTSIFKDTESDTQRDFSHDSLTVVDWLVGSYPNFFFVIPLEQIEEFADHYLAVRNRSDYEQFVARYGIRRTNADFWVHADWFHDRSLRDRPILFGLFDLNRYRNR